MGCTASAVSPEGETQIVANGISKGSNTSENEKQKLNGHRPSKVSEISSKSKVEQLKSKQGVDKNGNKLDPMAQAPVPKSVAFDVTLDGEYGSDLLMVKKRPPRLQALEPLNVPKLTPTQLAEKQRIADEKRERLKQKKINTSQKSSRRRKELLQAREFGLKQQLEQEKTEIDDSLRHAEVKREQRLQEIKEKQRIREERAKRARERAKRIQNPDEEFDVEKDEEFNAASDDSWFGNTNEQADEDVEEERGIKKRVGQSQLRPTVSASTVDSYDAAFMRQNTLDRKPMNQPIQNGDLNDDDFFGS